MKIEITNGYVNIRDIYPRKINRGVKNILFKGVELSSEGEMDDTGKKLISNKSKQTGFNMEASEEAKDYVLLHMIEEINIDGASVEVSMKVIDEMDTKDYDKIKDAIDKIAEPVEGKKE